VDGYVSTFFDARAGNLQIDGISSDGTTRQPETVIILVVCPSPGSEKVNR
jgi:hypothetical protein